MVKNKQQVVQWFTMILFVVLILCTAALSLEYYFFCQQTRDVLALKREYRTYVSAAKRSLGNQRELVGDELAVLSRDSADTMTDEFVPVKRNVSYLKDCMVQYFKNQQLENLIYEVGLGHWEDDWDKKIAPSPMGINVRRTQQQARKKVLNQKKVRSIPRVNSMVESDYGELTSKKKTFFCGLSSHLIFG